MPDVISFDEAIKASRSQARIILLGNGFSLAQGGARFSYRNFLEKSGLPDDSPIRKDFETLNTFDFEVVMKAREDASEIELAYDDKVRADRFKEDAAAVRDLLIHAIQQVHPGVNFEIPNEQCEACAKFLTNFDKIFTLNYDLLLYWVILRARIGFSDGFGLGEEVADFRTFRIGANCNTYYMHGALHLFLDEKRETLKRILRGSTIIGDIANTIRQKSQLPLIVAEGTALQKIHRIRSVPYLNYCYESLAEIEGSLFIFGHGASDNDAHIYEAICRSQTDIKKVFYCIHNPATQLIYTSGKLARYVERNKQISWSYVDAATANVWGASA